VKTYVEFRSDQFPATREEQDQINPGRWGRRLAEFVATALARRGFKIGDLIAEDWGWMVPLDEPGGHIWIGCGNYEEYPDGFLCFIEVDRPWYRRLFKSIDAQSRVEALRSALDEVLIESAGIRAKRWWTREEFERS
jgi:hypothetical protein